MKFKVTGYNLDNLIRTFHQKNIVLHNLEYLNKNTICFTVSDKQAKKVKRRIANYKVTETLSFVKRLPKIMLANIALILAVFIGSVFYLFISNYTWQIKVYGTEQLTENDVIQVLKSNGVAKGKINIKTNKEIEDILLNNYDRIAQVSVIKHGTAIIINLSEKLVYVEQEFKPIVAKHSGIIKDINIIKGTTNVKVGDYVNKGDVLVLPFNLDSNNNKISVMPLAEVVAEMYIVEKCQIKKEEQVLVRTGKSITAYKYKFNNFNLFSGKNKNSFALFELVVYNENISNIVPLNRDVLTFYELSYATKINDLTKTAELEEKSKQQAYKNLPVGEIISEQTTSNIVNDTLYAITTVSVLGIIND